MIDYHLHLVPHGTSLRFKPDGVRGYAAAATASGLAEIAITEHLFRFPDVQDALGPWWEHEPDARLREQMARYFATERLEQTLAEYVDVVLESAADPGGGATVRLGLEVDLFAGRMAEVVGLLGPHPWDVLLGAVHWLGAWGFDQWGGDGEVMEEWAQRRPEAVWLAYVDAVEEMAASGTCDVLAHVDVVKLGGVRAGAASEECDERLVKAAAANGLCVEVNGNGWNKPVGEAYPAPALLGAFRAGGVGITLGSDAHGVERVGDRVGAAAALARDQGYSDVMRFDRRAPTAVPLEGRSP